ncbi:MAG TPA: nuclear transport factor 2 family protein [Gemmatimonadales bacterium]
MQRSTLALLAAVGVLAAASLPALARDADEAAVRRTLDHYLQGHATGDGAHFAKAFHPDAKLFWTREGQLAQRTSADYIASASGRPAPDEARRTRRIVSVDVTGDAASAKIVLDYPGVVLTDYMSLLRIGNEWLIVNKIFTREPKPGS